jgi:hypothetical protein
MSRTLIAFRGQPSPEAQETAGLGMRLNLGLCLSSCQPNKSTEERSKDVSILYWSEEKILLS